MNHQLLLIFVKYNMWIDGYVEYSPVNSMYLQGDSQSESRHPG